MQPMSDSLCIPARHTFTLIIMVASLGCTNYKAPCPPKNCSNQGGESGKVQLYEPGGGPGASDLSGTWTAPLLTLMLGGAPAPKQRTSKRDVTKIICSLGFGWDHNAEPQPVDSDMM